MKQEPSKVYPEGATLPPDYTPGSHPHRIVLDQCTQECAYTHNIGPFCQWCGKQFR